MELEQMRQLDAIARHGTLSAAAFELHLSQSALSRSINRLELELGHSLFDRTHNSATLNDAGRLAVEHARILLADERAMRYAFEELARRARTLLVGSVAPAPVWRVTSLVVERFPGTLLNPVVLKEDQVERQLLNREVDLAVTLRPMTLPTMSSVRLMTEDLCFYLPAKHPLANRETLSFADMDGESFLVIAGTGFWMDVKREAMPHARIVEQPDRVILEQLLATSDLIGFVTDVSAVSRNLATSARRVVPISDASAHATFYLSILNDAPRQVVDIFEWVRHRVEEG